ncbi:hypothetical protein AN958_00657 [Leucoagaricus sp. SymC.cos]|nr:hypothetical protein AN958_00657 [Leucoagaricus sp. SymC.cos]
MTKFNNNGSAKDFWATLFDNSVKGDKLEEELEHYDEESLEARREGKQFKRPSLYVKVFEGIDMVNAIMEKETHLLSDAEWDILKIYRKLDYRARYLLVRLVLRQPDWHALSSLHKYSAEIGEEELEAALKTLCIPVKDMNFEPTPPSSPTPAVKQEEDVKEEEDLIDLTFLDGDEEQPEPTLPLGLTQNLTQPSLTIPSVKTSDREIDEPVVDPSNLQFDYLFRDQSTMTVREALTQLTVPDLKEIQRSIKVGQSKMRKEELINALIDHAAGQHTLPSLAKDKGKSKWKPARGSDGMVQTQLAFGQKQRMTQTQLSFGPCVKINPNLCWLTGRLHIISYRGTEKPTKYCLPALLAGFKKWNFPQYAYERTGTIWPTREDFLEYEEALYLDVEMENIPEDVSKAAGANGDTRFKTPMTPVKVPITPLKTQRTVDTVASTSKVEEVETPITLPFQNDRVEEEPGTTSQQRAKHVKRLFKERIYPKWKELLVRKEQEKGKAVIRTPGLERFEAGHVYTRMVQKAYTAFGTLKEYHTELAIIGELLEQTYWRKGKRSAWYERRALILERHLDPPPDLEVIKDGILQALADEYTGLVERPSLVRRLNRIQKKMKLHLEKWIKCDVALKSPSTVTFEARRCDFKPGVKLDQRLRPMKGSVPLLVTDFLAPKSPEKEPEKDSSEPKVTVIQVVALESTPKRTGKSTWVGHSDTSVNVETFALERYEMHGYVGFHSETRILTTIFALVFWDIIFSPVPGAFETQFQAGPLDMFEDSFYLARRHLFEKRLGEIEAGEAGYYLKRHDDLFRPKQTWCIGLRWDVCEQKQLLEIIQCLGAQTLAMICKLFCEDYAGRSSGVPDLIVWKMDEGICKFVEVKGPGDNPQPNQRVKIIPAGANVEICRVIDLDEPKPEPKKRKRKTPMTKAKKGGKGKEKAISGNREEAQEQGRQSENDGDYLPVPQPKRRKMNEDEVGEHFGKSMAPMSPLTNAPPGTPLSGRCHGARSIPTPVSGEGGVF